MSQQISSESWGSSGVAAVSRYTPPKKPCRTCRPWTARSVACQAASEKVSRYRGVQQLHFRVSRYTVQLRISLGEEIWSIGGHPSVGKIGISPILPINPSLWRVLLEAQSYSGAASNAEWPASRHRIASVFASWECIAEDFRSENAHRQDFCIASHRLLRV